MASTPTALPTRRPHRPRATKYKYDIPTPLHYCSVPSEPATHVMLEVLGIIAAAAALWAAFAILGLNWNVYAALLGVGLGGLAGRTLIVRLSLTAQAGLIGALLGVSLDGGVGLAKGTGAAGAVSTLSDGIATLAKAITDALTKSSVTAPQTEVAVGLWCLVGTVLLITLVGAALDSAK